MNDRENQTRSITGKVVSNKMNKSISIEVERLVPHPIYGKYIKRTTKLMAHDEFNICKEGDIVEILASRPLSKRKVWMLSKIIKKAK